ncbi:MAG: hypothetical protein CMI60_12370 [Parvibaculum sp.]|nr:hypothetical protein [Parvibaculum sp.]
MSEITIFAAEISTFGRIVAMVLLEKGLDWTLVPTASSSAEHMPRHPFGKTPAVEIDGHLLIESDAICRYVDDTFGGQRLYRILHWMAVAHTEEGKVMLHHVPNVTRWMSYPGSGESARGTAWPDGRQVY